MTATNSSNITAFESNAEEAEAAASSMDFLEKDDEMMVLPPSLENVTGSIPPILAAANATANHHQEYRVSLNITEFRKDPMYSINFNWFRFIAIGVVPFLLLVYFNTQIYLGIVFQLLLESWGTTFLPD